jgi:prepilin signal peptidase PulO-like enzyme (type II secretory pathway)
MSLKWVHSLTEADIKKIGAETGGRTLFFGGLLFIVAGLLTVAGIDIKLPFISDYTLITFFMIGVAIPAFIFSYRRVINVKKQKVKKPLS